MAPFWLQQAICGRRDSVRKCVRCSPNPHFFPLRGLWMPLSAAIQRRQRLMSSTAFLSDGAGGSAQTLISNGVGPGCCRVAGPCRGDAGLPGRSTHILTGGLGCQAAGLPGCQGVPGLPGCCRVAAGSGCRVAGARAEGPPKGVTNETPNPSLRNTEAGRSDTK